MEKFTITDNNFAGCGFRDYIVTAVEKGSGTEVTVTNPHAGDSSCRIDSCLTRGFDTSKERTITVTIKGRTFEPAVVSASFDISMGCVGIKSNYEHNFNIDASKTRNF